MADEQPNAIGGSDPTLTAGAMLRQARKAQGLHIAALAATLKVPPQKLELLETDRFGELPDATFARALAKAVCRTLKIDADPVLARLPQGTNNRLERMEGGLRAPYRERPGRDEPSDFSRWRSPGVWGPALLVLGAIVVLLLPDSMRIGGTEPGVENATADAPASAGDPAASAQLALPPAAAVEAPVEPDPATMPAPPVASVTPGPQAPPAAATAGPASAVPAVANELVVRVGGDSSWVQVTDGSQKTLLSRELRPGETVTLDGAVTPLRIVVGNVRATQVQFRGEPVDLAARSRENIARLELK